MPSLTLPKAGRMLKFAAALAAVLLIHTAGTALSAPKSASKGHAARAHGHRAFKAQAQDTQPPDTRPIVIVGEKRTVSANPEWDGTDWDGNGLDSVELTCPADRRAISGGLQAPDSAGVLLNGSHPGSSPDRWVLEVTYFSDGAPADWIPNVTCA